MPVGTSARPPPGGRRHVLGARRSTPGVTGLGVRGQGQLGVESADGHVEHRASDSGAARPVPRATRFGFAGRVGRTPVAVLVWMDLEMTGLEPDPRRDRRDRHARHRRRPQHRRRGPRPGRAPPPRTSWRGMDKVVVDMHTSQRAARRASGPRRSPSRRPAPRRSRSSSSTCPTPRTVPLCGNSIGTDRRFLAAYLPEIEEYLHYRSVDVSTIKELARRWYPEAFAACPEAAVRAPGARRHPRVGRRAALLARARVPHPRDRPRQPVPAGVTTGADRCREAGAARTPTRKRTSGSTRSHRVSLRIQLPIMLPGLGHVNCYVARGRAGCRRSSTPGCPAPMSHQELVERLRPGRRSGRSGSTPSSSRTPTPTTSAAPGGCVPNTTARWSPTRTSPPPSTRATPPTTSTSRSCTTPPRSPATLQPSTVPPPRPVPRATPDSATCSSATAPCPRSRPASRPGAARASARPRRSSSTCGPGTPSRSRVCSRSSRP